MAGPLGSLLKILRQASLAWTLRIDCTFVHTHPSNRDGQGVSSSEVHSLCGDSWFGNVFWYVIYFVFLDRCLIDNIILSKKTMQNWGKTLFFPRWVVFLLRVPLNIKDILSVGWDSSIPRPLCVELDEAAQQETAAFNVALFEGAHGSLFPLAAVNPSTVKYGSLACSHTNQVLRLFKGNVKHEKAEATMGSPKLTPEGLKGHDEGFYNAVVNGLEWTVLSAQLVSKWPCLLQMFSESSNTGGQLQRRESECQMGLRILNLVKGGVKEFKHLKDRLLRSKPVCGASVPFIYSFLLKFGGGPDSPLFIETCHLFWEGRNNKQKFDRNEVGAFLKWFLGRTISNHFVFRI